MEDMKRITEREKPLEERLSHLFEEKKRIAAVAAVTAITQRYRHTGPT
jgi:pyruvate carboxylase subunit A